MSEQSDERSQKTHNVLDHTKNPAPIDGALTDLHNNIEDAHQLITDLMNKIGPVLGYDDVPDVVMDGTGTPENQNSRIHNVVRETDARVVALQDRIRSLIRRVEL